MERNHVPPHCHYKRETTRQGETHKLELVALIMFILICKEASKGRPKGQSDCLCYTFGPLKIIEKNVKVLGVSMF